MAKRRLDSYIDRPAFASDTDFALQQLKSVADAYTELDKKRVAATTPGSGKDTTAAIKELNAQLALTAKLSAQTAKDLKNEADIRTKNAKALEAESKARAAGIRETELAAKAANSAGKATAAETKAAKEKAAAEKLAAKEEKDRLRAAKEAEAQAKRDKATLDGLTNDYAQLSKAYNEAALKAKNYALQLGEAHPVTVQAVADAKAMGDILKRVDASVGQFQRNVGNYAEGFSGLRNSINQVGRELPALAINTQTFLLAISNNLPILADEIGNAKGKIKELQEAGKPAPSLFQAIAGAVFSWQTALSVGITALTVFGPKLIKWVDGMLDGSNETKKAAAELDYYTQAMDAAADATDNFITTTQVDFGNTMRALQNQLAYAQAAGKTDKETLKIRKEIAAETQKAASKKFFDTEGLAQLDELKTKFEAASDAQAAFHRQRAVSGPMDEEETKTREAQLQTQVQSTQKAYEKQKEIVQAFFDANRDMNVLDREIQKDKAEEIVKLRAKEYDTRPLEDYQAALEEAAGGDDLHLNSRLQLREQAAAVEREIIQKQYDNEVEQARVAFENVKKDKRSSQADLINAQLDYNAKIDEADRDREIAQTRAANKLGFDLFTIRGSWLKKELALEKQANEDFEAETKARREKAFQDEEDNLNKKLNADAEGLAKALTALDKAYMTGKVTKKQYEAEKLEIENAYRELSLRAELQYTKNILEIRKQSGLDVSEQLAKIAEIEHKLNALGLKGFEDTAARKKELLKALRDELLETFTVLVNAGFEREKNDIQDEIDDLEKKKQAEIEAINATSLAEEEKANKIAILNARAQAQREQLELRQRQVQQRQAQFEKMLNAGKVVATTARGIMSVYADETIPAVSKPVFAALVAAVGAAQLAQILATPIPRYKDGTDRHEGGLALVNDGGQREVIHEPGKSPFLAAGENVIMDLDPGTKVYKSLDNYYSRGMYKNRGVLTAEKGPDGGRLVVKELRSLRGAILNKKEVHFNWDNGQLKKAIKTGHDFTTYINKAVN